MVHFFFIWIAIPMVFKCCHRRKVVWDCICVLVGAFASYCKWQSTALKKKKDSILVASSRIVRMWGDEPLSRRQMDACDLANIKHQLLNVCLQRAGLIDIWICLQMSHANVFLIKRGIAATTNAVPPFLPDDRGTLAEATCSDP
jgi:hypothetical protein